MKAADPAVLTLALLPGGPQKGNSIKQKEK
ncbi:MAG: hypothetical protein JWP81_4396 [Ferruginibacter sp.]|nr:hypothetical protein [Ferruginibacter sp.]